jgi:hypothetical protein
LDIIRHYADLPASFIDDIANTIDGPENGVTLEPSVHQSFDRYEWYFKPTGVCRRRICILTVVLIIMTSFRFQTTTGLLLSETSQLPTELSDSWITPKKDMVSLSRIQGILSFMGLLHGFCI